MSLGGEAKVSDRYLRVARSVNAKFRLESFDDQKTCSLVLKALEDE